MVILKMLGLGKCTVGRLRPVTSYWTSCRGRTEGATQGGMSEEARHSAALTCKL